MKQLKIYASYLGNSQHFLQAIKDNRTPLMGLSICCILIYHAFCWIYNPIRGLNIGYIGVDIFLFLSGFGLAYSYEKNTLSKFYKNRALRIFPIYVFAVCIAYMICFKDWSLLIFIENLTTLGFYIDNGVNRFDWYINGLITLYIVFPIFYHLSKLRYTSLIVLGGAVVLILFTINTSRYWWYDCFISRLPIFLYGIMFQHCYRSYKIMSYIGLLMYFPCRMFVSPYFAASLISVPLIFCFLYVIRFGGTKLMKIMDFCGKYSLELYLANLMVYTFDITTFGIVNKIILYFSIQIVGTFMFIKFTKILNHSNIYRAVMG